MTTRRKYVQRTKSGTLLTVSPEEEDLPSTTTTTPMHHHQNQWGDSSQQYGAVIKAGTAMMTASAAALEESKATDDDRFPLLPAPSPPLGVVDPRRATAETRLGLRDRTPAPVTSLASSPMRSSIISSTVGRSSRSRDFVRSGGLDDIDGARTSLERWGC